MIEIGLGHYLTLGAVIFSIGIIGIFLNSYVYNFRLNKIYTWVGASKSVLVSVNPFKRLPLYKTNGDKIIKTNTVC